MGSIRKRAAAIAAAATVTVGALALVGAPTAQSAEGFQLARVAGADRYATAAALATAAFPNGSDVAVVASGENFPDALAGSFLAGRFGDGAPILLTQRSAVPSPTASALDTLEVSTIYILGGTGAVSESVETALEADDRTVVRIAGANRYATAAAVASFETQGAAAPGEVGGVPTVIVASGEGFADALAAGPLAFVGNLPIVLTPAAALDDGARTAIEGLEAERAWIVGGTAAVGPAVADELEEMGLTVVRIAGANRYATAVAAANRGRSDLGLTATAIDLASGENFPDALAAGPASGAANRPLLLTARAALSDATEQYLETNSPTLTQGRVFGGTAAVSALAVSQANAAGGGGDAPAGVNRIVAIRAGEDEYDYVQDGTDEIVTVEYSSSDDFTVDGKDASVAGFEGQATPGDIIEVDDPEDADQHDLTNVGASSFTTGIAGNIDLANDQLDIVEPQSGAIFRRNIGYGGTTLRVDGATASVAEFEADVNEGDRIEVTGGGISLTNAVVEGIADDVTVVDDFEPVSGSSRFKINGLGDDPAQGSDPGQTPMTDDEADNDARYAVTGTGEVLSINGAEVSRQAFGAALNEGDEVTHTRQDGVERFNIVNKPEEVEGEATSTQSSDGADPDLTEETNDGGTFTMVDEDGAERDLAYGTSVTFSVDGDVSSEAEFEEDYSAGDGLVVSLNGTTVVAIELDNRNLNGDLGSINTLEIGAPDPDHSSSDDPNSYGVLAGSNEDIEVAQVVYERSEGEDTYFINGVEEDDVDCWEDYLAGGSDPAEPRSNPDATIATHDLGSDSQEHHLTDPTPIASCVS